MFDEQPNNYPRATALARTFHGLREIEARYPGVNLGIEPFDPTLFQKSMKKHASEPTALCAAFVLAVHNRTFSKKFDVIDAWGRWDDEHRAAALAWFKNPRTW